MPIIQIPFDLPFDYCKNCAALDPKAEAWYADHELYSVHFFCQNASLCTSANRAREINMREAK